MLPRSSVLSSGQLLLTHHLPSYQHLRWFAESQVANSVPQDTPTLLKITPLKGRYSDDPWKTDTSNFCNTESNYVKHNLSRKHHSSTPSPQHTAFSLEMLSTLLTDTHGCEEKRAESLPSMRQTCLRTQLEPHKGSWSLSPSLHSFPHVSTALFLTTHDP